MSDVFDDIFAHIGEPGKPKPDKKSQLEERSLLNQKRRDERLKTVIHYIIVVAIILAFLCLTSVLIVRVIHLVIGECYYWLSEEQLQNLDKFLFSGALGGVVGKYISNIFDGWKLDK